MNRKLFEACILSLVIVSAGNAQGKAAPAETGFHYTQAQMKELKRSAHAPDQFKVLASHYGEQHKSYLQKATEEKTEWDQTWRNPAGTQAKYPRPADSARNLYEYYMYKASQAGALEAKYSRLASQDAPVNAE